LTCGYENPTFQVDLTDAQNHTAQKIVILIWIIEVKVVCLPPIIEVKHQY
jgi:hypothetical protein